MEQAIEKQAVKPAVSDPRDIELGQWMGRREAFGLAAGRCSAAQIESVRRIKDEKLYARAHCTWSEFCSRHLHVARRTVDQEIEYLRQFGPAFFTIRQLTHVRVKDYPAIAPHVTAEGLQVNGAVVALLPENSEPLAAAVEELAKRGASRERETAGSGFDGLLRRCQAAESALRRYPGSLDAAQTRTLVGELVKIRDAGESLGARYIEGILQQR